MNNTRSSPLRLAVIAQSLYLINLLLLPGIALIALIYMVWHSRNNGDQLGNCHLRQTAIISGWFILLVVGGGLLLWFLLGSNATGLSMTLLYLIVMHTGFVLLGIIGLARAISGQHFHPAPNTNCTY